MRIKFILNTVFTSIFAVIILLYSSALVAETSKKEIPSAPMPGMGDFASSMMGPVSVASGFIASASTAIGISFMLATIIRFRRYRANPMAYPLTSVLSLALFACLLLLLPLIYHAFSPEGLN